MEPIYIGPDNTGVTIKNHESNRMPSSHGKVCKMHKRYFGKDQHTVYGCLLCNVHLCKVCHVKWHYQ